MHVTFLGAAQTVTGSMHLVDVDGSRVLLDCGLYQGRRRESFERNRDLPIDPRAVDAVVLSHAHIDHSGALPALFRKGYRGPIYATPATRDLIAVMLEDAAMIQAHDAAWINKQIEKKGSDMEPVEPLYGPEDVIGVLEHTVGLPYHRRMEVAEGYTLTFHDAGHVLGSAIVELDLDEVGAHRKLVFSGDLGRRNMPILRDPEVPGGAHVLLTESTYGDRLHSPIQQMEDELAGVISRTVNRGGKVIIPSFALERAQEVIYALKQLQKQDRLPDVPVYLDSPLAVRLTDVFRMHPDCFDAEARAHLEGGDSPFDFPGLRYVTSVDDSKRIDQERGPAIIIAASGMCEFGRVVHHLAAFIGEPQHTVLIVGFQAQHTLGRRLVEQRKRVRVLGVERDRQAEVVVLNGFSAHADRDDLIAFAEALRDKSSLRHVALVHGEPKAQEALAAELADRDFPDVRIPTQGETLRF